MDDQPWPPMSCSSRKIKGPPNRGGPTLTPRQATTIISRDAHSRGRCAIYRSQLTAPLSHVRAVRAGIRATSNTHHAPMQTEQRQPGRARQRQGSPKASRSPLSSPRIHGNQHIGRRGDQPGPHSSARRAGAGAGSQESGSGHKALSAKRNGQQCENLQKVPRRGGLLRKNKLLESPNFLCELVLVHLAAGQPCCMRWQNGETARPGIEPEET